MELLRAKEQFDILVVGAGLAGCRKLIQRREKGASSFFRKALLRIQLLSSNGYFALFMYSRLER